MLCLATIQAGSDPPDSPLISDDSLESLLEPGPQGTRSSEAVEREKEIQVWKPDMLSGTQYWILVCIRMFT